MLRRSLLSLVPVFVPLALLAFPLSQARATQMLRVTYAQKSDLARLRAVAPEAADEGATPVDNGVEFPAENGRAAQLKAQGFQVQIVTPDLEAFYASRLGPDKTYGAYHGYTEAIATMDSLAAAHPDIMTQKFSIGTTLQGRSLWVYKISDNPNVDENEPEVFFDAYIHAREAITPEVLIYLTRYLVNNYGVVPRVTNIVNSREIFIEPVVNPDGVEYNRSTNPSGGGMWRKNRRNNGDGTYGVDLNRNFGFDWGYDDIGSSPYTSDETYRGPSAFSELETQAIRNFVNSRHFTISVSNHSYGGYELYPWSRTSIHCPDNDVFYALGLMRWSNGGYDPGTAWEVLYTTNGGSVDWAYGDTTQKPKVMALVTETGTQTDGFWPAANRIGPLCAASLEKNLRVIELADDPFRIMPPGPSAITSPDTVATTTNLNWTVPNPDPDNPAVAYNLIEGTGRTVGQDNLEGSNAMRWTAKAWTWSTSKYHSSSHSYFSGDTNYLHSVLISKRGHKVASGEQLKFWTWYNIETSYDFGYVEVATDARNFVPLAGSITTNSDPNDRQVGNGITGSSSSAWVQATFSLASYVGQTIWIRFRYNTDSGTNSGGWYVDDIEPSDLFSVETTLGAGLTTPQYAINNHAVGTSYFMVQSIDADGDLSILSAPKAEVFVNMDTTPPQVTVNSPNGGEIWNVGSSHAITWTATDNVGVTSVDLFLSTNNGTSWTTIAAGEVNDGTYTWTVPNTPTAQALIKVTAHDAANNAGSDASNAVFTIRVFHIAASAGAHGTITPSGSVAVLPGASQSFALAADSCYQVADVVVDGVSVGAVSGYTFTNVQADHTIAASFALKGYTIVSSAGAGGAISPSGYTPVNCGASQAYGITADPGYYIVNVLVDGVSVGAVSGYTFTNVQASHTITANFTSTTFTIAASAGAGGVITPPGSVVVAEGSDKAFAITPEPCYDIADVLVDGSSVGAVAGYTFTNVLADHSIAAFFVRKGYTIAASAGAHGSISPTGFIGVSCGDDKAFSISADPCYHIADVLVDGVSVGAVSGYTFSGITASHSIVASFAINSYTITASAGAHGSITPAGAVTVDCAADQAFAIAADACYRIADVLVDGVSVGAVAGYTFPGVTGNHTIAASFSIVAYSLTTSVVGSGSVLVSPDLPVYDCGSSVQLTAQAGAGFGFSHWTGDATGTDNPLSVVMNENRSISAVFVDIQPPSVTLTSPNGGEVWTSGSAQNITWTATDNVGVTTVDLATSTDGGLTYPNVIATGITNSGSYAWTVPGGGGSPTARVQVTAHDAAGNPGSDASDSNFEIQDPTSAVAEVLLGSKEVLGVYPNPTSPGEIHVLYRMTRAGSVGVSVYDITGHLVKRLVSGFAGAGLRNVVWQGLDEDGKPVSSGIYLVRVNGANGLQASKRLVLVR